MLVAGGEPVTFVVRKTIWGPVIDYEEDVEGHELAVAWTAHRPGATDMELLRLERASDLDTAAAIIGGAGMPGTERDDRGRARPHRLGALGPAAAAPGHRSFAPVGLAHGRRGLGRLDPARRISAPARPAAGIRLERQRAGGGRRGLCADRRRRLRVRGARAPDPRPARGARARFRLRHARHPARRSRGLCGPVATPVPAGARPGGRGRSRAARRGLERAGGDRRRWLSIAERVRTGCHGPRIRDDRGRGDCALARFSLADARAFRRGGACGSCRSGRPTCSTRDSRTGTPGSRMSRPTRCASCRSNAWISLAAPGARSTPSRCDTRSARRCRLPRASSTCRGMRFRATGRRPARKERISEPRSDSSVSPGREEEGYLHMPGGQSGHPLSPFYRAGHDDWARGEPTPFLPGPARHTLKLVPGVDRP